MCDHAHPSFGMTPTFPKKKSKSRHDNDSGHEGQFRVTQPIYFQYTSENGSMQRAFSADSESDEDIPEELKQDFIDELTGETEKPKPRFIYSPKTFTIILGQPIIMH